MGCDARGGAKRSSLLVSIHAPAWGATWSTSLNWIVWRVSIHAPAWGATVAAEQAEQDQQVSIHAPAWGATRRASWSSKVVTGFNPRTRVGCDPMSYIIVNAHNTVSIHAPAWGATSRLVVAVSWSMFQSTHPRGVRRYRPGAARHDPGRFNPRTRVGCDLQGAVARHAQEVFQSTHPRGVRRDHISKSPRSMTVSIHAPAWGATSFGGPAGARPGRVSIHAPAWGATSSHSSARRRLVGFNPRTRVGCDSPVSGST